MTHNLPVKRLYSVRFCLKCFAFAEKIFKCQMVKNERVEDHGSSFRPKRMREKSEKSFLRMTPP